MVVHKPRILERLFFIERGPLREADCTPASRVPADDSKESMMYYPKRDFQNAGIAAVRFVIVHKRLF